MTDLIVQPCATGLRGVLFPTPDVELATLALATSLATTPAAVVNLRSRGLAPSSVIPALRALGVEVEVSSEGWRAQGPGFAQLRPPPSLALPASPLAAGFVLGILAGLEHPATLESHAPPPALAAAARVCRRRGGVVEGELRPEDPQALFPPLRTTAAPAPFAELSHDLSEEPSPGASLAAKAASLGSGLISPEPTFLREPLVRDDRLERLLLRAGADLTTAGAMLRLASGVQLGPIDDAVPASLESVVALTAAALSLPGSHIGLRRTPVGPSRSGWIEALTFAGASIDVAPTSDDPALGAALATLSVSSSAPPRRLVIGGEQAVRAGVDPILLFVLATTSDTARLSDLEPLDPDDVGRAFALLGAFGTEPAFEEATASIRIEAASPLSASTFDAENHPSLALGAVALALRGDGPSRIRRVDALAAHHPRFIACLRALGADIEVTNG